MKWPKYLQQKEILFSPGTSQEELIRWGDRLFQNDRLHDAVAFYGQAKYPDGLNRVRIKAVEEGDYCLFREALDGMESPEAEPGEWSHLGAQAEASGRWHDALKAYEQLNDARGQKRAKEAIERMMAKTVGHSEPLPENPEGV